VRERKAFGLEEWRKRLKNNEERDSWRRSV